MWSTHGLILGPKLFLSYINDNYNISAMLNFILFADDINMFCSGKDHVQLSKDITIELQKLHVWLSVSRLSKTN